MKKIMCLALLAVLFAGCASTGTTTATTTEVQTFTLEEALQKSAETRQKLQEAQAAYQNAKAASSAANQDASVADAIKAQVQEKINTSTTQINNEVQAWKEVLAN